MYEVVFSLEWVSKELCSFNSHVLMIYSYDKPILKPVRFSEFNQCIYYIKYKHRSKFSFEATLYNFHNKEITLEKRFIIMHENLCNDMHVYSEQAHLLSPLTLVLLGVKCQSFPQ